MVPFQSHYLGATNARDVVDPYLAAIQALIQTYRKYVQYSYVCNLSEGDDKRISDITPLVVNTMGWVEGLGAVLNHRIEELVEPTHVISMRSSKMQCDPKSKRRTTESPADPDVGHFLTFAHPLLPCKKPVHLVLDPIHTGILAARYSNSDWRAVSMMSYFYASFCESRLPMSLSFFNVQSINLAELCHASEVTWNTELPLRAQQAYAVDIRPAFDRVVLIGPGHEDVVPPELGRILNGAVVAMVHDPLGTVPRYSENEKHHQDCLEDIYEVTDGMRLLMRMYKQGGPLPDPQSSCCIGLALIRGVSPALFPDVPLHPQKILQSSSYPPEIHMLTPIPSPLLGLGRCLVKGQLELPIYGMLDHCHGMLVEEDCLPYLTWAPLRGLGADRTRFRRNISRKRLHMHD